MLRRLSPKSQQIIQDAQTIARGYEQEYVDVEHVLLAIADKNDCPAAQMLRDCGVSPDKLRKKIEKSLKQNDPETFVIGRLPATIHFKNVVARAVEIAEKQSAPSVEPVHLPAVSLPGRRLNGQPGPRGTWRRYRQARRHSRG